MGQLTMPVIRPVVVELLRRGPRHNQLLSPLTDYLAVCGDFPAGVVNVPYEQADAEALLEDLRYRVASVDSSDRLSIVRERAGTQLAEMLEQIPGLGGVLGADTRASATLTHLRLVTSAAELALLPFEMTKGPVGAGGVGGDWLLLQPDRPVCLTRHVRGVARATTWPLRPRILFVTGDDVPVEEHIDVFERVLAPFRVDALERVPDRPRHRTSEHLTVIERATLDEIREVADEGFTHVHVLAHGAELEGRRTSRFGLALGGRTVSGSDLALALASRVGGARHLPHVVTLASCDSAAQGSVTAPGGSVAHDLHAAGIPLVIGSQFPISEDASVPFTETFYRGQLWGEHPLVSITDVRRQLATEFHDEHAWASVVVYEALPVDLDDRLDELAYRQSRRAQDIALTRFEQLATSDVARMEQRRDGGRVFPEDFASPAPEEFERLAAAVLDADERLPTSGAFAIDCRGLRAASAKRRAEVAYWLSQAPDVDAGRCDALIERCLSELETALELYGDTVRALLATSDGRPQRKATLHWIVGQTLTLQAVLGFPVDGDLVGIASAGARFDLDHDDPVIRSWATVSLIEQAILRLAVDGPSAEVAETALEAARDLVRAAGDDSEHALATCRQMRRYASWWGDARFVELQRHHGIERGATWDGPHGVVETACAVAELLRPVRLVGHPAAAAATITPTITPNITPTIAPAITPTVGPPPAAMPAGAFAAPAAPAAEAAARVGVFDVELLPARNGDCIWISYGTGDDLHHVMIDCGAPSVADVARERILAVPHVELFVLTHIDADHISGAIPLFADPAVGERIGDVWFNGWDQLRGFLSVSQGEAFSELLGAPDRPFRWNGVDAGDDRVPPIVTDGVTLPEIELDGGMRLTVLSPTRGGLQRLATHWNAALAELDPGRALLGRRARPLPPAVPAELDLARLAGEGPTRDSSVPNLSSIAVLAEFGGRAVLCTGDAHADVLVASIEALQAARGRPGERLRLDALKLSHHGSANATTRPLLDAIDCHHYLVPTDGSLFYHPDREAIARVIVHGGEAPVLHFNYRTDLNAFWDDPTLRARYGYATEYPPGDDGLRIEL